MVAVLTALPDYRYGPESFLAWVFGIAAHKVADRYRVRRSSREHLVPSAERHLADTDRHAPGAGEQFIRLERDRGVGWLMRRLPEADRAVLAMRPAFGYSAEETARRLGMPSAGAVRVAQHRALRRIRQLAGEDRSRDTAPPSPAGERVPPG